MNEVVITGCDKNTEWQLPWFTENYHKHNTIPLLIADMGMTEEMVTWARLNSQGIMNAAHLPLKGWMKKPHVIANSPGTRTVWMDTDCEVRADISEIFMRLVPDKLLMAEDRPWTQRRGEKWHNSGVVGIHGHPDICYEWARQVTAKQNEINGDQEVLHWMMGGDAIRRLKYIEDLPSKYNTLRLDIDDGRNTKGVAVMHWTGEKGNNEIRRQMKNA